MQPRTVHRTTVQLRYNEPRYNKPSEQRLVLEATSTIRSGQQHLEVTNPSVQQMSCVSLSTPKAFIVSKVNCSMLSPQVTLF